MDADRRAGQIEPVRDTRRDVILLVCHHRLERAESLDEIGARDDVLAPVGVVVLAGEHADRAFERLGDVPGALECSPRELEEDALLGIHDLGLLRRDAEEAGVELVDVVDDAASLHVGRIVPERRGDARVQLRVGEARGGLPPFAQDAPHASMSRAPG